MELLGLVVLLAFNFLCMYMGARLGQKIVKGEELELPKINPMEAYRNREAKKEAKADADRLETIMQNIDRYDGTEAGQKDVG